jgi:hypothetical protein
MICKIERGKLRSNKVRKWSMVIFLGEPIMRVAMYYSNRDVRLEEMPKPKIGSGEILVKVMACGICESGSPLHRRMKAA